MKGRIIYIGSFLLAFIFVSSAIIYLNTIYNNIFKFDFSPVTQQSQASSDQQDQKQAPSQQYEQKPQQLIDTSKIAQTGPDTSKPFVMPVKKDSVSKVIKKDSTNIKKNQSVQNNQRAGNQSKPDENKTSNEAASSNIPSKLSLAQQDTTYIKWIKKTGKLYEAMDAKKAAKIILGYSDNIARDLLLSMRKKKAAEILSEIKPEIATRIISLN